jgi:polyhydroxybutyrate depolymerase
VNQTNPVPIVIDIHDRDENDGSTVEYHFYGAGINMFTVEHFKVIGGGHHWPGFSGNMDIDASEEVWNFFSKFDNNGLID